MESVGFHGPRRSTRPSYRSVLARSSQFAGCVSVDYIFTDPPFGENIYYADLNILVESWHGVRTNPRRSNH